MARQTVIAFFFDRENADTAVLSLRQLAIPDDDLTISPFAATRGGRMSADVRRFWAFVGSLLGSSHDHRLFAEGVRRGYVMVVAQCPDAAVGDAVAVLEHHGAVDLDACERAWQFDDVGGGPITADAVSDQRVLRSSDDAERQAEMARAAACVLAAASPGHAYRSPGQEATAAADGTARGETRRRARVLPFLPEATSERDGHARTHGNAGQEHVRDDNGPSPDRGHPSAIPSSVQRASGLEVVGSDGQRVGIIEVVEGTVMRVRLDNPAAHHAIRLIPTAWIHSIDDRVTLKVPSSTVAVS